MPIRTDELNDDGDMIKKTLIGLHTWCLVGHIKLEPSKQETHN